MIGAILFFIGTVALYIGLGVLHAKYEQWLVSLMPAERWHDDAL